MPRRLRRDSKYEEVYQKLCNDENAVFNQLSEVFLMAACIGYKMSQRKPLTKPEIDKAFRWEVFSDSGLSVINAIALAETNDFNVVIDETEDLKNYRETIIEEYANAGIEYLKGVVLDKGGSPTENLLAFLYLQKEVECEQGINLGILSQLSEEL